MPKFLQELQMQILTKEECRKYEGSFIKYFDLGTSSGCVQLNYTLKGNEKIVEHVLCAKNPTIGKATCQGDSGGPLTVKQNDQHILVGITSYGYGCGLVS